MRDEVKKTDSEIVDMFDNLFSVSCEIEDLVFTRDSFQDLHDARKGYAEAGTTEMSENLDSLFILHIGNVQVKKGMPRKDIYGIDFGTVRVFLK